MSAAPGVLDARGPASPGRLCFRVKAGVLREVMGIMVSYRVLVKLIVGGSASLPRR